jgi:tRNA 2-thiocytidine biosynthesis protein TtcA
MIINHADRLAHFLLKKVNRAIREFDMISDGDRVAVALSGGKDSFSLLRILEYRLSFAQEKYSLVALHVLGDTRGPDTPSHPPLEAWLRDRGIEFEIRPTLLSESESLPMPCQRCTWNRRRTLFEMACEKGCNKIAFGHHLDDLAETALMNLIHHGRNETMAPVGDYLCGRLKLIRPMIYVPERELKGFAAACQFPPPPPLCPLGAANQRSRIKYLLGELKKENRRASSNLVRAAFREMGLGSSRENPGEKTNA